MRSFGTSPANTPSARGTRVDGGPATDSERGSVDVAALMAAAGRLVNPLRSATFQTLIGLLAATGLRGGEAMRLNQGDVDWAQRLLTVRDTNFGRSRQVYLHQTTFAALDGYCARKAPPVSLSRAGEPVPLHLWGAALSCYRPANLPPPDPRGRSWRRPGVTPSAASRPAPLQAMDQLTAPICPRSQGRTAWDTRRSFAPAVDSRTTSVGSKMTCRCCGGVPDSWPVSSSAAVRPIS